MRHVLSAAIIAALFGLALGSGSSEPAKVRGAYTGPDTVQAGQAFTFSVDLINEGDATVTLQRIEIPRRVQRSLGVTPKGLEGSTTEDGLVVDIQPITVAPGGRVKVADFDAKPYLSGSPGSIKLCGAGNDCHRASIGARVKGGAEEALDVRWDVPDTVPVGRPFALSVTMRNDSGGPDVVEEIGLDGDTTDWFVLQGSEPAHKGEGDQIGVTQSWRYGLTLNPGDETTVTLKGLAGTAGNFTFEGAVCPESESFCIDRKQTVVVE